jgi:hypothetical protein
VWPRPVPDESPRPPQPLGAALGSLPSPTSQHGLGRLIELDETADDGTSEAERWRERAAAALERGDLWFACSLPVDGPTSGRPADVAAGEVLTAVESAGWRLERVDPVWAPPDRALRGDGTVHACCLFRPVTLDPRQVWPDPDHWGDVRPRHAPE